MNVLKHCCSVLFATLLLLVLSTSFAEVNGDNNHLNATFKDTTLEDALGEIVDSTGITIVTSQKLEQKVFLTFKNITLDKLLKRLLHGYNAMYLRNPSTGQLESVRIFASSNTPPPITNTSSTQTSNNQAEVINGQYYMLIRINGNPVRMLVDTGANTLAISQDLALKLALPMGRATPVNTAAGKSSGYMTVVDSVSMAGQQLQGVQALILPNLKGNGLIGQNVLAHFRRFAENGSMRFEPIGAKRNTQQENTEASNPIPAANIPPQPALPVNLSTQKAIPQAKTAIAQ